MFLEKMQILGWSDTNNLIAIHFFKRSQQFLQMCSNRCQPLTILLQSFYIFHCWFIISRNITLLSLTVNEKAMTKFSKPLGNQMLKTSFHNTQELVSFNIFNQLFWRLSDWVMTPFTASLLSKHIQCTSLSPISIFMYSGLLFRSDSNSMSDTIVAWVPVIKNVFV